MKKRTSGLRALVVLPIVVLLAAILFAPASAMAATETSTYGEKPPVTTPSTGTSPSKEEAAPATTPKEEPSPTATTEPAKEAAKTLPFTGFDLRWSLAIGLLLIAGGSSIVLMQHRRREDS